MLHEIPVGGILLGAVLGFLIACWIFGGRTEHEHWRYRRHDG